MKKNKICTCCGTSKSLDEFYLGSSDAAYKDGHQSQCKTCQKQASTIWGKAHPKARYKTELLYRQTHPEVSRKSNAKYRALYPLRTAFRNQSAHVTLFKKAKTITQITALANNAGYPDWPKLRIEVKLNWDIIRTPQLARAWLDARDGLPYRILLVPASEHPTPILFEDPWAYIAAMKQAAEKERETSKV